MLNTADIRSKQHDYRQLYFKQDELNESLSDLERNCQSWSEEIALTKQRDVVSRIFHMEPNPSNRNAPNILLLWELRVGLCKDISVPDFMSYQPTNLSSATAK